MAVGTLTPPPARTLAPDRVIPWRCSVDDYERMHATGIFDPDLRTELLDGRIFVVPPAGALHSSIVDRLNRLFTLGLQDGAIVRVQGQIPLSDWSYPAPDLSLLARSDDFYARRHPSPDQCLLFVEVAHSSLRRDRETKLPLYAAAGIAEYWIVDVRRRLVIVHRDPNEGHYGWHATFGDGQSISPQAFPDLLIAVEAILGPVGGDDRPRQT
ncbi:MAG: Uma2 family endonuclease [Ardenticatenia bacterium]|nr:Uma2 family endonuclease [Ardenticatenia bacterium]